MHSFELRVYIEDTDAGGVVFHTNYIKYLERARTEWLREFEFSKNYLTQFNLMLVVKSIYIDYQAPAMLDDLLTVNSTIKKHGKSFIDFEQSIYNQHKIRLIKSNIKTACVDVKNKKVSRLPNQLYEVCKNIIS